MNETITANFQVAGEYLIQKRKAGTGELVQEVGPFKNVITNFGLNYLGLLTGQDYGGLGSMMFVGTGTSTPSVSNLTLDAQLAKTSLLQSNSVNRLGPPDYVVQGGVTFRFEAGVATGNITEVGLGGEKVDTSVVPYEYETRLWSRALIVDTLGNPVTITVLADEYLDVTYLLKYYPPLNDGSGTFLVSGTSYSYTARIGGVPDNVYCNPAFVSSLGQCFVTVGGPSELPSTVALGTIFEGFNNVTNYSGNYAVRNSYVSNSLKASWTVTYGLSEGNGTHGINAIIVNIGMSSGIFGATFKFLLNNRILKTASKVLSLNFEISWSRKT